MSVPSAATLSANHHYTALLRQLHELIRTGRGDSEEADALRDRMDSYWHKLSEDQITHVRSVSADLHTLSEPMERNVRSAANAKRRKVLAATQAGDWVLALGLLRETRGFFEPHAEQWLRYIAYKNLGETDVAVDFGLAAAALNPDDQRYAYAVALYLSMLGRFEDALTVVETYATPREPDWETAILHGCLLFQCTRGLESGERRTMLARAISVLEPALARAGESAPFVTPEMKLGYHYLAFCFDGIGKRNLALDALTRLLGLEHMNAEALAWRGLFALDTDPVAAMSDFEKAVELHCMTTAVPYLHVAQERLRTGEYHQALELCNRILGVANSDLYRALALQWAAISLSQVGAEPLRVRSTFLWSKRLDSTNAYIDANIAVYESQLAARGSSSLQFNIPPELPTVLDDARARQLGMLQQHAAKVA